MGNKVTETNHENRHHGSLRTGSRLRGAQQIYRSARSAGNEVQSAVTATITVTVLHALCWLPDVTSYLLAYHVPGEVELGIYHACVIPVGLGSCLNPIV